MTDQTPDPWEGVKRYSVGAVEHHNVDSWYASTEVEEHSEGNWLKASEVNRALAAERVQHQQEIVQRDETIRQQAEQIASLSAQVAELKDKLEFVLHRRAEMTDQANEKLDTLRAERDRWKAVGEYYEREWENVQLPRVRKAEAERDAAQQEVEGQAELIARANQKADDLRQQIATLTQERDEALKVLAPNMPESGLVDACRQVKQVAVSEAGNSTDWMNRADAAEARCATLTEELNAARAQLCRISSTKERRQK